MTTPFRHDNGPDHLNDQLDAMNSGAPAPEMDDLALAASALRRMTDRAKASVRPDADGTFDAIWEEMMSAHVRTAQTAIATVPATRSTGVPPPAGGMHALSRVHSLLSAALVALMIAGIIGAAWTLRGNGGSSDPGGNTRLAATALNQGTPDATPETDAFWMEYVVQAPQFCESTIVPATELSRLLSKPRNWPERAYTPLENAPQADAIAAARAARDWWACGTAAPVTDRYLWELRSPHARPHNEQMEHDADAGKAISADYPIQDPTAFVLLSHEKPNFGIGRSLSGQSIVTPTYLPDHAVTLADGRIAIPPSLLVWADDPNAPLTPDGMVDMRDFYWTRMTILAQEDGEWKVDEDVLFCVGHCSDIWDLGLLPSVLVEATPSPTWGEVFPSGTPGVTIWIPPTPWPTPTPSPTPRD